MTNETIVSTELPEGVEKRLKRIHAGPICGSMAVLVRQSYGRGPHESCTLIYFLPVRLHALHMNLLGPKEKNGATSA